MVYSNGNSRWNFKGSQKKLPIRCSRQELAMRFTHCYVYRCKRPDWKMG